MLCPTRFPRVFQAVPLVLGFLIGFAPLPAASGPIEAGIGWPGDRQQQDGSFAPSDSVALFLQAEAEAEAALLGHDVDGFLAGPMIRDELARRAAENTEFLALAVRQAIVRGEQPTESLGALLERQNRDGGFAEAAGHPSSIQATAFALQALHLAGHAADESVQWAIAYLVDRQRPDGSWNELTGVSDVYTTALATRALSRYAATFGLAAELSAAGEFLRNQRREDGGYGTSWETAHAVRALLPITSDPSGFAPAIDWLLDSQQDNGSWEGDLYATGVALRALTAASRLGGIADDPDTGLVSGRLVSEADGAPIARGDVAVEDYPELGVTAGSDGVFELALPADEAVTLAYEAAGFAGASQSVQVAAGGRVGLGPVALAPLPDTGRLVGAVTGGDTGLGLGDAMVAVTGDAEVEGVTAADGGYALSLPAGTFTVTADASGYHPASADFTLEGGQTLEFAPALAPETEPPPAEEPASVAGALHSSATGDPIAGAAITSGDRHAASDAAGEFLLADLAPGEHTLAVTADGYRGVTITLLLPPGQEAALGGIALDPLSEQGSVGGLVTDAETGGAVTEAMVSISGAAEMQVAVDSEGGYQIALDSGFYTLSIDAPGYYGVAASLDLASGQNFTFSPALTPDTEEPPEDAPVSVAGRIVASDTGHPIAGAAVASLGTEAVTDADGRFVLEDLTAGEQTFSVVAAGYAGATLAATLPPAESLDLGTIALEPVEEPEVTLTGVVADAESGAPLPGAVVSADGYSVQADATGRYTLAGLAVGTIDLTAEAEGYRNRSIPIQTQSGGTLEVSIALEPRDRGGLRLSSLRTDAATYEAHQEAGLTVDLENTGSNNLVTRLYLAVFDGSGELLSEAPVMPVFIDGEVVSEALEQALEKARVRLEPGEALTESFSWFTEARPPGTYELRVRAYEAFNGELLGERSQTIQIEPTRRVELVSVRPDPLYLLQGATYELGFTVLLQHRSNESFSLEGAFDLMHPDGSVLRSESFSAYLTPEEINYRIDLSGEPFTAEAAGEHEIMVHPLQGPEPLTVHGISLFVAPGTRLEIRQDRAPGVVAPDGDHPIDIEIRLEGKEE